MTYPPRLSEAFLDGVDTNDGDSIPWNDSFSVVAITVDLEMTRELSIGDHIWCFL